MTNPIDKRFVLVAGKGGVGRTTVAAALALAAARRGRRVLIAQTNAPERLARLLGVDKGIGAQVTAVDQGLWAVNMCPKAALREYGLTLLRYEAIYRAVFENKAMRSFLGAFPGLDYWSMLGKAWWHTTERENDKPKYDLVVLDGPASGHAAAMLRIPDAVKSAMPKGPLARDAGLARALLSDKNQSAVVLVSLPEELPARETVVLARTLRELNMPLGPLVVNAMPPAEAGDSVLARAIETSPLPMGGPLHDILPGVSVLASRRRDADRIINGLTQDPGLPMVQLPRLPSNDLGRTEVDLLANLLADGLSSFP